MRELFRAHQHFPDFADHRFEKVQVALLGNDHAFPVPLIHVGRMIVVEEVVFAHGAHIRANTLPDRATELFQRHSFPLGGCLHDLGVDRMKAVVV